MKISNINGLGSFGIYIDDVDLNNITDEEWKEIGRLHLKTLVTIIRGANLNRATFYNLMNFFDKGISTIISLFPIIISLSIHKVTCL